MSFATCALIPPESVEIALDAIYTIEIKNENDLIDPPQYLLIDEDGEDIPEDKRHEKWKFRVDSKELDKILEAQKRYKAELAMNPAKNHSHSASIIGADSKRGLLGVGKTAPVKLNNSKVEMKDLKANAKPTLGDKLDEPEPAKKHHKKKPKKEKGKKSNRSKKSKE